MNHEARIKALESKIQQLEKRLESLDHGELLTVPQVAKRLNISNYQVRQLLTKLKPKKDYLIIGKHPRIKVDALAKFNL